MTKKNRLKCKFFKPTKRRKRRGRKKVIYQINCVIKRLNIICPKQKQQKQPFIGVKPKVRRYFFVAPHDINLSGEKIVLFPNQFVDDKGETVAKFIDFGQEGYFNLYVNGALQEGKLYHVNSDELTIISTGQTIYKGTPIILESIGFIISRKK
ncbi:DUF4183 domain-containing protein [Paenibacillus thermoaerophilus]|uniref:DUF4183 domain-containing protein n=1 Tax=Paenibacillus thermoaerophilus TaxID=1215385 RepID=A0ABW2V324_9BACL|nr:DUF4183 domain-containing protein [Paenibacillus thermoaerophilus]